VEVGSSKDTTERLFLEPAVDSTDICFWKDGPNPYPISRIVLYQTSAGLLNCNGRRLASSAVSAFLLKYCLDGHGHVTRGGENNIAA
jgi:hypothetical protein